MKREVAMVSLLIVDDHAVVREGLRQLLKDVVGFKVVGEASSGEEAITLSRQLLPDVVLMDLFMPGIGGLEATSKILRSSPETKVLVLTARDDLLFPKRLLQAGAVGYMTKDAKVDEVMRAIQV